MFPSACAPVSNEMIVVTAHDNNQVSEPSGRLSNDAQHEKNTSRQRDGPRQNLPIKRHDFLPLLLSSVHQHRALSAHQESSQCRRILTCADAMMHASLKEEAAGKATLYPFYFQWLRRVALSACRAIDSSSGCLRIKLN